MSNPQSFGLHHYFVGRLGFTKYDEAVAAAREESRERPGERVHIYEGMGFVAVYLNGRKVRQPRQFEADSAIQSRNPRLDRGVFTAE